MNSDGLLTRTGLNQKAQRKKHKERETGKSLTTKGAKYTKGERGQNLRAFFLHDLRVTSTGSVQAFVFETVFPLKTVEP